MCGFFGQYNTPNLPHVEFKKLLAMSAHRGPDQTGIWETNRVQLGFNRLAILDLSKAGHQPLKSSEGKFVIVFNGEIYNHLDLRKKLPAHAYKGHSDTETISRALEVWGIRKTIEQLDGMFALAILEVETNQLTLARDFAGIKPLFYGHEKGQLVFASQYDQLRAHPLFREKSINPQVLKLYLKQHFIPAPYALHEGLRQVQAGEILTFSANGASTSERYWELEENTPSDLIQDENAAIRLFSEAFESSVTDQLMADVPLGAFLSGGIDSPLVCSFARLHKPDIEVFTIGSNSEKHDESEQARAYANALHLNQHLWQLDGSEMQSYWLEATACLHEPLGDFSVLPTYLVAKLARQNATVALSGDGGDELFFGYERFGSVAKNLTFQHWPLVFRKRLYQFDRIISGNRHVNSLLALKNQSVAHQSLHSQISEEWLNRIAPDLQGISLPDEWKVYDFDDTGDLRLLMVRMRKAEFYGMMQKTLRKLDLAGMQNSLEVRVPFLQKKTIEAALQIDPLLNIKNQGRKRILEQLLVKQVPSVKPTETKKGFSIPLRSWITGDLKSIFKESLNSLSHKHSFFNPSGLNQMFQTHTNGKEDLKWPLFTLYALQCQN
jgi:asparagine synthase (glutamine-hydrolysing)